MNKRVSRSRAFFVSRMFSARRKLQILTLPALLIILGLATPRMLYIEAILCKV